MDWTCTHMKPIEAHVCCDLPVSSTFCLWIAKQSVFSVFGYCSEACVWYICKCRKHYGRLMKLLVQKTRISILHLMDFWVDTFLLKDAFPAQQPRTCQYCLWKVLFCDHIGKLFIGLLNNSGQGLLQIQGLLCLERSLTYSEELEISHTASLIVSWGGNGHQLSLCSVLIVPELSSEECLLTCSYWYLY